MKINKNVWIAGVPATTIKKLLEHTSHPIDVETAATSLGWRDKVRTANLLNELVKLEYLAASGDHFSLAMKGTQFVSAKFVNYITREMAERVINLAQNTADIVNDIPTPYRVRQLRVHGAYMTDATDLPYLDLTIAIETKATNLPETRLEHVVRLFERLHDRLRISVANHGDDDATGGTVIYALDGPGDED